MEVDKKLSSVNGKNIMYSIIDGNYMDLTLDEILEKEGISLSEEIDYDSLISEVI